MRDLYDVIVAPVMTEKATAEAWRAERLHLHRAPRRQQGADRPGRGAAWDVKVEDVRTAKYAGKARRSLMGRMNRSAEGGTAPRPSRRPWCASPRATTSNSTNWVEERIMALKKFKPVTPGTRFRQRGGGIRDHPEGSGALAHRAAPFHRGRNHHGRMTSRRRGGGHKRRYRRIDFRRDKLGFRAWWRRSSTIRTARPTSPSSTTWTGRSATFSIPGSLSVGTRSCPGPEADIKVGNALPLQRIPLGTTVHNVELKPGKGGQMARSAGAGVQVVAKEGDYVSLRLPSTEVRRSEGVLGHHRAGGEHGP
jgi:ribosomal protein L23